MRLSSIKFINTVKLCAYSYIWEELGYELTKCQKSQDLLHGVLTHYIQLGGANHFQS